MTDIADYLLKNYFPYFKDIFNPLPTRDEVLHVLECLQDRMVVVKGERILGVALYLTLDDETFARLPEIDIDDMDRMMSELVHQRGKNIYFVLLAAESLGTILKGVKEVKRTTGCSRMAWWSPDRKKLHRYNFN